jgi:hypothetical protein
MIGNVGGPRLERIVRYSSFSAARALKTDQVEDCGLFCLRRGMHIQVTPWRTEVEEEGEP